MTVITIRLPDDILQNVDTNANALHLSRSEYIKKAILEMNKEILRFNRAQRLMAESLRVREQSMRINAEFDAIEDDPVDGPEYDQKA
jgi:metal-responsive CopG/Arc/MetJ family transcriptional regulator